MTGAAERPSFAATSRLPLGDRHVSGLSWSSDGRYLAVASSGPALSIWEVARPDRVDDIRLPAAGVAGPFWAPQTDKIALLLDDGSVGLWAQTTGERLDVLCDPLANVACGRWSPDGSALVGLLGGRISLWDSYRGGPKRTLQAGQKADVLEWSPDSAMLASGGARSVMLWSSRSGALKRRLDGAPGRVLALAWSPDMQAVAAGGADDAQIRVWSTHTGGILQLIPTGAAAVSALGFSRCGKWLAGKDSEGRLRLWETQGWQECTSVLESSGAAAGQPLLAFSPASATLASYDPARADLTVYALQDTIVERVAPAPAAAPLRAFISYSHEDKKHLKRLLAYLEPLKQESGLEIWSDRAIDAGAPWHDEIRERLTGADIILFLVSPPLFSSDYIREVEWQTALARYQDGSAIVVPVILRIADWKSTAIGAIQALPEGGKPITTWGNKDAAFQSVAEGLRRLIARRR